MNRLSPAIGLNSKFPSVFYSLRARLLLFVLLIFLPALAVIVLSMAEQRRSDTIAATESALRFARLAASSQGQQIAAARQLLSALAVLPAVQNRDSESCNPYFAALLEQHPQYSNISVVSLDGRNFFCSALPSRRGVNITDRAWFQRAVRSGEFVVGNFIVGRTTTAQSISFAYPVRNAAGTMTGVAVVSAYLDWLSEWLGQIDLPPDSRLTVVDSHGVIIARYPVEPEAIGVSIATQPSYLNIEGQQEGTFETVGSDGKIRLFGFTRLEPLSGGELLVVVGISKELALAQTTELERFYLASLLAGTLTLIAVAWFGSRQLVILPIRKLLQTTHRLAGGHWSERVQPDHGIDELDQLALSINQLAATLERRETDVARFTEELQNEIRVRRETEQKLQGMLRFLAMEIEARRAAQLSDERKLRFLAMVAHELRNPLTAIKGFTTTLMATDIEWDTNSQNQFYHIIDEEADVLLEMVEQLLDLSQIESGMFRIQPVPCDLREIVREVQPRLSALAANHVFTLHMADEPLVILADSRRLKQVMVNLVTNAVKYSPHGTPIKLCVERVDGAARVRVVDQGMGIAPDEQGEVFKPFNQANSHLSKAKGAGLGLAICKGIVEAHGGHIWLVDSSDTGTTFAFEIPLA